MPGLFGVDAMVHLHRKEIPLLNSLMLGAVLLFGAQEPDTISFTPQAWDAAVAGYELSIAVKVSPGGACIYGTRELRDPADKSSYEIVINKVIGASSRIACRIAQPDDYLGQMVYMPGMPEALARLWASLALQQEEDLGFPADVYVFFTGPNEEGDYEWHAAVGIYSSSDGSARGEPAQPDTTRVWR